MRSIVTVTVPNAESALTTLARVKLELDILTGNTANDEILELKIDEASSDIEAALGFHVPRETVAETFWHDGLITSPPSLVLNRTPIASITSVVVDDVTYASSLYRYDAGTGELFALDSSGFPTFWCFCKSVVVTYAGGYILPAESNSDLPDGIQGACVDLVQCYWYWKGRDPTVKSEAAPGVMTYEYWVGAVGEAGELPPNVVMRLAPYRRVQV